MSKWYEPFQKGARQGAFIFTHFLLALLFVVLGFLLERALDFLGDPKLFHAIPWRYVIDAMDLSIVITFVVVGVVEAIKIFRGD